MRYSSISSSFANEKEKDNDRIDHVEDTGQELANADSSIEASDEANEEAWCRSEKRIVRKLDMTLLPTVGTLYLFKCIVMHASV